MLNRQISVAPMLDWTDRHCRYFLRLISRHALLYTEMVVAGALLHGARDRLLAYHPAEHPVALQLGGSEPLELAECARIAEAFGYDEVNLNVGCPSERVQTGRFGACLMMEPALVADCVAAMRAKAAIPVTVKTRIGVDERDSYEELCQFIAAVAAAGCEVFIIHARKAWLKGLSPKENREIPPLRYDVAQQLKRDFPRLTVILNGGITTLPAITEQLSQFDGVMIGREAYHNPYLLADIEKTLFQQTPLSRPRIVEHMYPYIEEALSQGVRLHQVTRHMLGLFHGLPGARAWRRYLSEHAVREGAGLEVLQAALEKVISIA